MSCHLRRWSAAAVLLAVASLPVTASDKPVRVSGGGGFPLTSSVTSMWGAVDEVKASGSKPLTFMIYFRGSPGWHDRKWKSKQQLQAAPYFIEFSCDLTTLRADFDVSSGSLTVFGQRIDIAASNVLVVDRVDHPGEEVVTALGRFDLHFPEEANPAVWLLQKHDDLRARVVGPAE